MLINKLAGVLFLGVVAGLAATSTPGQDPIKAAPRSYKLQFENGLVKVLRVNYAAREKVPVHDHSRSPAAYVYLSDSGPITFRHTDWEHPILTRQPVKAGSFRLSPTRAGDETHEAENPNDTASEFLRIELKYLPVAKTSVIGRFPREPIAPDKGYSKVHFDNENLRAARQVIPRGHELKISAPAAEPALIVIVFAPAGKAGEYLPGQTIWVAAGQEKVLKNNSAGSLELLRFDLKPASDRAAR